MPGVIIGSKKQSMKKVGVKVTVPDHDVCRLSYYLHCVTMSCGLDIIVDDLVDYKNAHRLPSSRQDSIFKLAYMDFDRQTMTNATIVEDFENELLDRGMSNDFYEVSQVESMLAIDVQQEAMIGGQRTQVRKIMVFNRNWIEHYYEGPIRRNMDRIRRVVAATDPTIALLEGLAKALEDVDVSSKHCSHCKGNPGGCACSHGCDVKSDTQCSAGQRHCSHCRGLDGDCTCENGCPTKSVSLCHVVHKNIICDACHTSPIRGSRYKCRDCSNYDLCETCYDGGKHDKTHRFERIDRVGSYSILLSPRQAKPAPPGHCAHCDGARGACTCTKGCNAKTQSKCHVVHKNVACDGSCQDSSITGPRFRCQDCAHFDLCKDCYDRGEHYKTHSFHRIARVGSKPIPLSPRQEVRPSVASAPVTPPTAKQVHKREFVADDVPVAEAVPLGPATTPPPPTAPTETSMFKPGQKVQIKGLSSTPELNGSVVVVVGTMKDKVVVRLCDTGKVLQVLPQNLEASTDPPSPIAVGELVQLHNLSKEEYNDQLAVVTHPTLVNGRIQVKLLDDDETVIAVLPDKAHMVDSVY